MHYQQLSKNEALEHKFLYWKDALLDPKHRGSRVRVVPHKDMLKECGYCKKVKVLGVDEDVYFDEFYVDYYAKKTGVDYRKLWKPESDINVQHLSNIDIAQNVLYDFLKSQNVILDLTKVRHAMIIKFHDYLEAKQNDNRNCNENESRASNKSEAGIF
ncbi:MAG: hypothetical protein ACRC1D_10155 [Culicoidibacterales bacterium]